LSLWLSISLYALYTYLHSVSCRVEPVKISNVTVT
jgi:hypothetical protein